MHAFWPLQVKGCRLLAQCWLSDRSLEWGSVAPHYFVYFTGSAEGFSQADKAINSAIKSGRWVMLKNVHLAPTWLVQLEKKLHRFVMFDLHCILLSLYELEIPKRIHFKRDIVWIYTIIYVEFVVCISTSLKLFARCQFVYFGVVDSMVMLILFYQTGSSWKAGWCVSYMAMYIATLWELSFCGLLLLWTL